MPTYVANCDGSKTPNAPDGVTCWGFIIHDNTGQRIYAHYGCIGTEYSHNVAEYYAVHKCLQFILQHGITCEIKTDSKLVVDQISGKASTNAENLVQMKRACDGVISQIKDKPKIIWIPGEKNIVADSLTRKAHDYFQKSKHVGALSLEAWYVKPWNIIPS